MHYQLSDFFDKCLNWQNNGIIEIEGKTKHDKFMEFYADEAALKELVLSLPYKPYLG